MTKQPGKVFHFRRIYSNSFDNPTIQMQVLSVTLFLQNHATINGHANLIILTCDNNSYQIAKINIVEMLS